MKVRRAVFRALLPCIVALFISCPLPNQQKRSLGANIVLVRGEIGPGESVTLSLRLYAPSASLPTISWSAESGGIVQSPVANEAEFTAPDLPGEYKIKVKAVVGETSYEAETIIRVRLPSAAGTRGISGSDYVEQRRERNIEAVTSLMFADSTPLYLLPAEPNALGPVFFKLRLPSGSPGSALLHLLPSGGRERTVAMAEQKTDAAFDYYLAEAWSSRFPLEYWFEWRDGFDSVFLFKNGTYAGVSDGAVPFRIDAEQKISDWAKGASLYFIVPDRFSNADFSNDPEGTRSDWNSAIRPADASQPFGGDIEGMDRKLEYLRTLGVDALVVDSVFGGDFSVERRYSQIGAAESASDGKLADFISRARARGLKVILDAGIPELPTDDPGDSLIAFAQLWCRRSMSSGIRPPARKGNASTAFYAKLREQVKSVNPDAALLSPFPAPDSNSWDLAAVPETFFSPLSVFLTGIDPRSPKARPESKGDGVRFLESISAAQTAMPQHAVLSSVLSLDEPGYARLSTRLQGNGETVEGQAGAGKKWLGSYKEAALLLMSLPGAPAILYGSEAALEGAAGADSLRGYPWGSENKEMISVYKDLAGLRKTYTALKTGSFKPLFANESGIVSFLRWDQKSRLIIAVNDGSEAQTLKIDAKLAGLQSGERVKSVFSCSENGHSAAGPGYAIKDGKLTVALLPRSGVALLCPSPKEIPPTVEKRPALKRIFPADKAKDLSPDTRIIMEFSEEMEQSSIMDAFRILPEAKGSFIWNGDTCTFVPTEEFLAKTDYAVSLGKELRSSEGGFALKEGRTFSFSIK